jgi:hypothetical protein
VAEILVDRSHQMLLELDRELLLQHAQKVRRRDQHPAVKAPGAHGLIEHRRQGVYEVTFFDLFRGGSGCERVVMHRAPLGRALSRMVGDQVRCLASRSWVAERLNEIPGRIVTADFEESSSRCVADQDPNCIHEEAHLGFSDSCVQDVFLGRLKHERMGVAGPARFAAGMATP